MFTLVFLTAQLFVARFSRIQPMVSLPAMTLQALVTETSAASVVMKDIASRGHQRSAVQKHQSGVMNHLDVKVLNKVLSRLWISFWKLYFKTLLGFFHSVAVECLQLHEPVNGHMNCTSLEPTFGTICIFSCHDGFQIQSNEMVMCNDNGSWSGEVTLCQGKHPTMTVGSRCGVFITKQDILKLKYYHWLLSIFLTSTLQFNLGPQKQPLKQ